MKRGYLYRVLCLLLIGPFAMAQGAPQVLYMQPGRPGYFTTTPPQVSSTRPGGYGELPINVDSIPTGSNSNPGNSPRARAKSSRQAPSTASKAPPSSSPKGKANYDPAPSQPAPTARADYSDHPSHSFRGAALRSDIQGGARLQQRIEEEEREKRYLQWLNSVQTSFANQFNKEPRTAKDLHRKGAGHLGAKSNGTDDGGQSSSAEDEALVMMAFEDQAKLINRLKADGLDHLTINGSQSDWHTYNVLQKYAEAERDYLQSLEREGTQSTLELRSRTSEAASKLQAAADQLNQIEAPESEAQENKPSALTHIDWTRHDRVPRIQDKIDRIDVYSPQGATLKDIAQTTLTEGKFAISAGDIQEGNFLFDIAESVADMALGITPFVGVAKDIYEAVTGRHLISGRQLDEGERFMAAVGVASLGVGRQANTALKLINKVIDKLTQSSPEPFKVIRRFQDSLGQIQETRTVFRDGKYANELTAKNFPKDFVKAWDDKATVREVTLGQPKTIWKVHGPISGDALIDSTEKRTIGYFAMLEDPREFLKGKDLEKGLAELRQKYAIDKDNPMTHFSAIEVPKGETVLIGKSAKNEWGDGGGIQVYHHWEFIREWRVDGGKFEP